MCSPLLAFLRKVDAALDAQVETPVFAMEEAELAEALLLAHRVSARLDETELRLAHQASSRDADAKTAWVRGTQQAPRWPHRPRSTCSSCAPTTTPTSCACSGGG